MTNQPTPAERACPTCKSDRRDLLGIRGPHEATSELWQLAKSGFIKTCGDPWHNPAPMSAGEGNEMQIGKSEIKGNLINDFALAGEAQSEPPLGTCYWKSHPHVKDSHFSCIRWDATSPAVTSDRCLHGVWLADHCYQCETLKAGGERLSAEQFWKEGLSRGEIKIFLDAEAGLEMTPEYVRGRVFQFAEAFRNASECNLHQMCENAIDLAAARSLEIEHLKELLRCDPSAKISDGFGSTWSKTCPTCGLGTMRINRPGEAQCDYCG
jgi:hypothetical protein